MLVKRLALIVISLIIGVILTHLSLWLMNTTVEEFGIWFGTEGDGIAYYPLTILSFALAVAVWLDKFLNTEILPK